jgi:hypothetical protein
MHLLLLHLQLPDHLRSIVNKIRVANTAYATTDSLNFVMFVQTLGLSHALTSFMWLCGPIAGLVVSNKTYLILLDKHTLMLKLSRFNSLN